MHPSKSVSRILAGSVATIAMVFGGLGSANAAAPVPTQNDQGRTIQTTIVNQACLSQLQAVEIRSGSKVSTEICTRTVVAQTSVARTVTAKDLEDAKVSLNTSDYASLVAAVATSTVKAKSYSQTIHQITDQERQYGTFYYNGSRAWVTQPYLGVDGSHFCVVDYAIGFGLDNLACSDSGSTVQRNLTMIWQVSLIVSGGPISWSETYTLHVNKSGSIWQ